MIHKVLRLAESISKTDNHFKNGVLDVANVVFAKGSLPRGCIPSKRKCINTWTFFDRVCYSIKSRIVTLIVNVLIL